MNKEQLELKLTEYTEKYKKVIQAIQEYEVLANKLQGAMEAVNGFLQEMDKENKK